MKRIIDILISLLCLFILALPLILLALLIYIKLGKPVLFMQVRAGLNGQPFRMVKFRSMTDERDGNGAYLPDVQRLTSFGIFLRAYSLDELPELWNVLNGDMSLVGPRPLLLEYLNYYTPEQTRRHEVRPGITGWAQINGRNAISWAQKFEFDVWYVENYSTKLDLLILWRTIRKVIFRDGVNAPGEVTMPKFEGYDEKK